MQKKKILIIDDFQPLLNEIADFLNFEGYSVYTSKDGAEGIQMALQVIPDLVICDIEMPKIDGYEVFKALENIPLTCSIPFIFLTARVQPTDFRKGLSLGVDDYLTKPIDLDELILTIRKRLQKSERYKKINEHLHSSILNNPLTGIYIYYNEKFRFINQKFEEVIGYQLNELNKINPETIIIGDSKNIINQFCQCLKGIHDTIRLGISVLDKNKMARFIDIYGKSVEIEGHKAIVGSAVSIPDANMKDREINKHDSPELDEIISRLMEMSKEETAMEVVNIQKLIAFDKKAQRGKIKEKVNISIREKEILELICKGLTNSEIADKLFISNRTVDNHRAKLIEKTQTKNTAELVAFAILNKLVDLEK